MMNRQFQERQKLLYFWFNLSLMEMLPDWYAMKKVIVKEYNLKRHYSTKHGEQYEKYQGDEENTSHEATERANISAKSLP